MSAKSFIKRFIFMGKHQDYDKVLRESIERAIPSILEKLCGLRPDKWQDLPTSFQRTRERRPDFLKKAVGLQGHGEHLVQIEFQSSNDPKMAKRMLDYYALIFANYDLPLRQFVIYVGRGAPAMSTELSHVDLQFRFSLVNLKEVDCGLFLKSERPEEILFAILADFRGQPSGEVIRSILIRLQAQVPNPRSLRKYLEQLEILSQLRNLQPETVQQIDAMPITYDITADLRYQQGLEQGQQRGESKKTRFMVERMLLSGKMSISEIAEIAAVSVDYVIAVHNEMNDKNTGGEN
jgi:predicted transposase YdaD